jgi:hypothetical protein
MVALHWLIKWLFANKGIEGKAAGKRVIPEAFRKCLLFSDFMAENLSVRSGKTGLFYTNVINVLETASDS